MKFAQAQIGRVFVLRLEDGDCLPQCIERLATEQKIIRAFCAFLGGVGSGALVTGPAEGSARPVEPLKHPFDLVHEAAALGTIFPDEEGRPSVHMHAVLGRAGQATAGCIRPGIAVWQIGEAVIWELKDLSAQRRRDRSLGFTKLELD